MFPCAKDVYIYTGVFPSVGRDGVKVRPEGGGCSIRWLHWWQPRMLEQCECVLFYRDLFFFFFLGTTCVLTRLPAKVREVLHWQLCYSFSCLPWHLKLGEMFKPKCSPTTWNLNIHLQLLSKLKHEHSPTATKLVNTWTFTYNYWVSWNVNIHQQLPS